MTRLATGLLLLFAAGSWAQQSVNTVMEIGQPFGVEVGPSGALYVTAIEKHLVVRYDLDGGRQTTVAQKGLNEPYEVRFDADGNLFFVEMLGQVIRRVDKATGRMTLIAGTPGVRGFGGDGGPATKAQLASPHSIAIDTAKGHLYVADIGNNRIRMIDLSTGIIDTIAGNGEKVPPVDGQIATGKPMIEPRALYIRNRDLWIALRNGHSVWRMDLDTKMLEHIAGTGEKGYSGDGGPAVDATMNGPKGIAVAADGSIYVVDTENQVIRVIDPETKRIETYAGMGPEHRGYGGDGGDPRQAKFDRPHGICVAPDGAVYIGDTNNNRVRVVR